MLKGCKHYATKVMKYEDGGLVTEAQRMGAARSAARKAYDTSMRYNDSVAKSRGKVFPEEMEKRENRAENLAAVAKNASAKEKIAAKQAGYKFDLDKGSYSQDDED